MLYGTWLRESPKRIQSGPLELVLCDGYGEDDDAYNLESHDISSSVLDSPHIKHLYIMGFYEKYEGFKIYVNMKDKFQDKFLLMGHQHHEGSFETEDGRRFEEDHPHFHQLKYYRQRSTKIGESRSHEPRKTYEVPPSLCPGMNSQQLLKAFVDMYYFDDGKNGEIKKLNKIQVQSKLGNFEGSE